MPFADLHCHPSFWSFNQIRNSANDADNDPENHIWYVTTSKKAERVKRKGGRAIYSQADFSSLSAGDVKLVFASLYPVEKGFFMGNREKGIKADVMGGVLNQVMLGAKRGIRKVLAVLLWPVSRVASLAINNEGWGRDILQKMVMNFSRDRINYFQSDKYHYFSEMELEYNFYKKHELKTPLSPALAGTKPYKLISDGNELELTLSDPDKIAVVLTIEGMHAFTLERDPGSADYLTLANEPELLRRIQTMKNHWNIFFITFSHHYSNHLAGHAHSLPKLLTEITNPAPLMNEGFLPIGEKYIRELLSITAGNKPDQSKGRRILIDVKHFSARSRKDYYERIVLPFNKANPAARIPVIASHCGYFGQIEHVSKVDLDYLAAKAPREQDDDIINGFYRWNINLCDEDIQVIVESEGLIGLSFDQRIMGEKNVRDKSIEYWIDVMARHIVAIVTSSVNNVSDRPHRIWDCLCIGSDFDGIIDPLDPFQTSEKFNAFKTELRRVLEVLAQNHGEFLGLQGNPYTPDQVVEKIAFANAYEFTKKHFN